MYLVGKLKTPNEPKNGQIWLKNIKGLINNSERAHKWTHFVKMYVGVNNNQC